MKEYPLQIENVGEDTYILMSRGHHDIHEFMKEVREHYNWPLGVPKHLYVKAIPDNTGSRTCSYVFVDENTRGCFPVTYTWEAYGEYSYEWVYGDN